MLITIVVAALALIAGVVTHWVLRSRLEAQETPFLTVRDFVLPLQSLTIFVLAFVLVTASASNGKADDAARKEAGVVDHMFEVADFAPDPQRQRLQADVVCYARAVRAFEWPAMAEGHGAPQPSVWTTDFRASLKQMGTDAPAFGMLMAADKERSQARQTRIAESTPAIPSAVYWLMLAALAFLVLTLALCLPRTNTALVTGGLILLTALLTSVLLVIRDVERPFSGVIQIPATAISGVESDITDDYRTAYGPARLPCTDDGAKTTA
ncbi:bestrophin-like domain [Streptomyces sp. NPDC003027]